MKKPPETDRSTDLKPDIREIKHRLSGWSGEFDPKMHQIHLINSKAHRRSKAHRTRR